LTVSQRRFNVVFFDVGGTLIAPSPSLPEIYSRVLVPLGIDCAVAEFRRASVATWAEMDALVGKGRDRYSHFPGGERDYWRHYVRRVLERVSDGKGAEEAASALHAAFSDPSAWAVFPDAQRVLPRLRDGGYRLGVISNWDSRLRPLLSKLGIAASFETMIVSCEVGAEKPDPVIFERALAALKVRPSEAFHVGDDFASDYQGARAVGLGAALLVRKGEFPAGARGIARLDELPGILLHECQGSTTGDQAR